MKITILDRILLLLTGLLAAYQIAVGIDDLSTLPIVAYTIGFGVILLAALLLIILGFDALDSPLVVIASTIIPLSLSLGLVWEHLPAWRMAYLAFTILGFLAILITRLPVLRSPGLSMQNKLPVFVLAVVHGIAGMTIFLLPVIFSLSGRLPGRFALVGVGGGLIGVGGLLLAFLKAGKPLLSRLTILMILPGLLLLMTAAFVVGFAGR
jgi:hypothetical protein